MPAYRRYAVLDMDYRAIIFYLSLFLIVGSLAEIVARKKDQGDLASRNRGRVVPTGRSTVVPTLLLVAAVVAATATRFLH